MNPRIIAVKHVDKYCLELTFASEEKAELDFHDRIVGRGGVFKPLEDIDYFKQVSVDKEIGTIVWPNEVDFCPDVLYAEAMKKPDSIPQREPEQAVTA